MVDHFEFEPSWREQVEKGLAFLALEEPFVAPTDILTAPSACTHYPVPL